MFIIDMKGLWETNFLWLGFLAPGTRICGPDRLLLEGNTYVAVNILVDRSTKNVGPNRLKCKAGGVTYA